MANILKKLKVKSSYRNQMIDITADLEQILWKEDIKSGVCIIFVPHTTGAVTINENADPDVTRDFLNELDKIVPWEDHYRHAEGNSAAHIKASMMGFSETILIEHGKLLLGTWQGVYFTEFDGPRTRTVYVKLIPDSEWD